MNYEALLLLAVALFHAHVFHAFVSHNSLIQYSLSALARMMAPRATGMPPPRGTLGKNNARTVRRLIAAIAAGRTPGKTGPARSAGFMQYSFIESLCFTYVSWKCLRRYVLTHRSTL